MSTDVAAMLADLSVSTRPGRYTFARVDGPVTLGDSVEALIAEAEGTTVVASVDEARRRDWPFSFEACWLTLDVRSSLEAVGLTAAVAGALAAEGIACNVLAGRLHDHLLVPADRSADALACLRGLGSRS